MAILLQKAAQFNYRYSLDLNTINSGLVLYFDQQNQYKRIDKIAIAGYSDDTGAPINALTHSVFVSYRLGKGNVQTLLASSPWLNVGAGSPEIIGTEIEKNSVNLLYGTPYIEFTRPLLIDPTEVFFFQVIAGYDDTTGAQNDVFVACTVYGEYIPERNAGLTKERYLNLGQI